MLTLAAPVWLSGLIVLPLIRWLHRGGPLRRAMHVSRLGLWRGSAATPAAAGQRQSLDPAWRRRALFAALVLVALSGPQLSDQRPGITLWIDDSLSMLTREPSEAPVLTPAGLEPGSKALGDRRARVTRLALGLAQARLMLASLPHSDVELRSLGDPWRPLGSLSDAVLAGLAAGAGQNEPRAPPSALLRRGRLQWLVTDGAHAALLDWPDGRRADRIIQVGIVTSNVGLERISARRSLEDPEKFDLLLKVTNGGNAVETREVVFSTVAGEWARSTQRIAPGTSVLVHASIAASARVHATLKPGDALVEDDRIDLDLAPLRRRRVASDPTCPAALLAALGTHPALAMAPVNAADVDLLLDCGTHRVASDVGTLRVFADRTPTRPAGAPLWSSVVAESRRIRLSADRLHLAARLQVLPNDAVLLMAGDEAVIVSRAGASRLLETSLDFESMAMTSGPEIPLLANLMFEQLLGKPLLDKVVMMDRGPASTRVAPSQPGGVDAIATQPGAANLLRDWTAQLLWVATLALLWEIVALVNQWLRLGVTAAAESA